MRIAKWVSCLAILILPSLAHAWEARYLRAERADQISTCNASQYYRDAAFIVRIYGEEMDFLFRLDSFTLPYGTALGPVAFDFGRDRFVGSAATFSKLPTDVTTTSQTLLITVKKDDYAGIFDDLRNASNMVIVFPNNDSYTIDLRGSAKALNEAAACWKKTPTGPLNNNPFAVDPNGNNPFGNSTGDPQTPKDAPAGNPFGSI